MSDYARACASACASERGVRRKWPDSRGFRSAARAFPTGDAVLLLFHPAYAATPGRGVPTHGTTGPGHIAFRVTAGMLDQWLKRFAELEVEVELDRTWKRGGRSLYVRDPAGNSVELVEGEIWPA
ncbi:MAG: VOC family protein [Planctomycetes bacterium]|nr:VOC family protein [Planctomycetota bacterium]